MVEVREKAIAELAESRMKADQDLRAAATSHAIEYADY